VKLEQSHRDALHDVLQWRRDVRHFKTDPIEPEILRRLSHVMDLAPSVGNARPWRILNVESSDLRAQVIADFEVENAKAATKYKGTKKVDYMALKLAGLHDAPVHLAVFTDHTPAEATNWGVKPCQRCSTIPPSRPSTRFGLRRARKTSVLGGSRY